MGSLFLAALGCWVGPTALAANMLVAALLPKYTVPVEPVEFDACLCGRSLVMSGGAHAEGRCPWPFHGGINMISGLGILYTNFWKTVFAQLSTAYRLGSTFGHACDFGHK